jgi:hypothetical protein
MVSRYESSYKPGDSIHSWTVLEQRKGGKWLLRCGCGTEKLVDIYSAVKGTSKSCSPCSLKDRLQENNPAWRGARGVPGKRWSRLVNGAKTRGIEVTVDFDYVASLFTDKCALSGLAIDKDTGSVDRIDSSVGYIEGNIQWVHKDVNRMKNNLDQARFVEVCKLVAGLTSDKE